MTEEHAEYMKLREDVDRCIDEMGSKDPVSMLMQRDTVMFFLSRAYGAGFRAGFHSSQATAAKIQEAFRKAIDPEDTGEGDSGGFDFPGEDSGKGSPINPEDLAQREARRKHREKLRSRRRRRKLRPKKRRIIFYLAPDLIDRLRRIAKVFHEQGKASMSEIVEGAIADAVKAIEKDNGGPFPSFEGILPKGPRKGRRYNKRALPIERNRKKNAKGSS